MPKFRIEFVHEGEKEIRKAEVDFIPGFEHLTLFLQLSDWEERYFDLHHDQQVEIKAIVALEALPEYGVQADAVVWRDWMDLSLMSNEAEEHARQLVREFKPVWDDPGLGYGGLLELLAPPERWEEEFYR